MKIQVNTDHNIEGREALGSHIQSVVKNSLNRYSDHISRIEVHLSFENCQKNAPSDKRCMMEARLEGYHPMAVIHQAGTLHQAVEGAANKLAKIIGNTIGRRLHQVSHRTDPPLPEIKLQGGA